MDTLTHSLLGAVVVRAVFPAAASRYPLSNHQRMLTGALAGAFPDVDYLSSWIDPMLYLAQWHRGITHSLVMLPLWSLLIGVGLSLLLRKRNAWPFISLLAGVALLSHVLSDLITVYGTQVLAPVSAWRASVGTTFIIDPLFTLIVLVGFIAGWRNASSPVPLISVGVLLAYIVLQAVFRNQALQLAERHMTAYPLNAGQAAALPQPFSPRNWKLIIDAGEFYEVAYVNLGGGYAYQDHKQGFAAQVMKTYQSPDRLAWQRFYRYGDDPGIAPGIQDIWLRPELRYFRRFAAYPALYRLEHGEDEICAWFTDLRYVLPYMTPPFRYKACQAW